jgi:excinuclease UvrABC nuclease subunit
MISILETLHHCKNSLNLNCHITQLPFRNYKEIPQNARGVYILEDDIQRPIYVGKGWIRKRQDSHWTKAQVLNKSYHTDPKGWQYLREQDPTLSPKEWTIYYTLLNKETAITALEGALIHILQPLANDETYRDNQ